MTQDRRLVARVRIVQERLGLAYVHARRLVVEHTDPSDSTDVALAKCTSALAEERAKKGL